MTQLRIKAILFDFDGTLTRPGALDFPAIKKAIGCPLDTPILEYIDALPTARQQTRAMETVDRMEMEAAAGSVPNDGAENLIAFLKSRGHRIGIVSRNSLRSILRALENFNAVGPGDFDIIVSRDDPVRPKPSGQGVRFAAENLHISAWIKGIRRVIVVGKEMPLVIDGQPTSIGRLLIEHLQVCQGKGVFSAPEPHVGDDAVHFVFHRDAGYPYAVSTL